jgi:hypothetical protein
VRPVLAALAAAFFVWVAAGPAAAPEPGRIVAVGDVHGDIESLRMILREAGLLGEADAWAGGAATLVQTGDFLDRGADDRAVMDLLMKLEREAPRAGGRVIVLMGNHEAMNIYGDLRYVAPESYADFAGKDAEKRRQNGWRDLTRHIERNTPRGAAPELPDRAAWLAARPPGYFEHREAFGPRGRYGRWLRSLPALAEVGGTIFLHGGINAVLAAGGVEGVNKQIRGEIRFWDETREEMLRERLILPFFDMPEIIAAADRRRQQLLAEQQSATLPPEEEQQRRAELVRMQQMTGSGSWYSVHPDGPLWFRGFATWTEEEGAPEVTRALAALGGRRFVVGHSVQPEGRIGVRFDRRVFLIDTGMLSGYYAGGRASALEIAGERIVAIYPGERVVLAGGAAALPAAEEREETYGGGLAERPPAQQAAAPEPIFSRKTVWLDPDGNPLPFTSDEQVIEFLRRARIRSVETLSEGITRPSKVLLERDGLRMHAVHRQVDIEKPVSQMADGTVQLGFRDSFYFEIAAYEMARLLGLDTVPPVTRRTLHGNSGSLQAWVEKSFNDRRRRERNLEPPDPQAWDRQYSVMRVFDALIANSDRNQGNILIGEGWRLWMIDHTRAFRRDEGLPPPQTLRWCERRLWKRLRELDARAMRNTVGRWIRPNEMRALEIRHRKLIEHFEALIAQNGEANVLYSLD